MRIEWRFLLSILILSSNYSFAAEDSKSDIKFTLLECHELLDVGERLQNNLNQIQLRDWTFKLGQDPGGGRFYVQAHFPDYDSYEGIPKVEKSGKRYLSEHMKENEVIQQALALAMAGIVHQVRKNFLFASYRIFGPHFNLSKLAEVAKKSQSLPSDTETAEENLVDWISQISIPNVSLSSHKMHSDFLNGYAIEVQPLSVGSKPYIRSFVPDSANTLESLNTIFEAVVFAQVMEMRKRFLVKGQATYATEDFNLKALLELCQDSRCLELRDHK